MQFQNVQQSALANDKFRKVLFTNKHSQVVLMSIPPGEDIGREVHELVDQVLVFVKGRDERTWAVKRTTLAPVICLRCRPEWNTTS